MHAMKLLASTAALCAGAVLMAGPAAAQFGPPPTGPNPAVIAAEAKPTPKSPWGTVDLTGVWDRPAFGPPPPTAETTKDAKFICVVACNANVDQLAAGMGPTSVQGLASTRPDRPKYKAEFQKKVVELETDQVKYDPVLKCANPGLPRIGAPDKIVQSKDQVVFLYEDLSGSFWRIVPTDGRKGDPNFEQSALGQSVGHWEGDTLVIVTDRLTDDTWLIDDGAFHTDALTVTERLKRVGDTLQYEAVANDPAVLAEPWKKTTLLVRTDNEPLQPVPCQDQTLDLIVDGSHHDNAR